jgi:S1-C subfamily serine protease
MLLSQTFTGKRDGRNPWAYYGVQVATAADRAGCVVNQVAVGSPAAAAGIKPGDVITHVGNQPIATFNDYARLHSPQKAGDTLAWTLRRGSEKLNVQITAAELPEQQPEWIESAKQSD